MGPEIDLLVVFAGTVEWFWGHSQDQSDPQFPSSSLG